MSNHFKASLRELRFFLWEVLQVDTLFDQRPYAGRDRASCDALLERGRVFALEMGEYYRSSDIEECHLDAAGNVILPRGFRALWKRWSGWEELGAQGAAYAQEGHALSLVPPPVKQAVMEMLMGANPAFMCFGGFTAPAARLIHKHGTDRQKALLLPRLESFAWDACYCATESEAGSDLLAIQARGRELTPGLWALEGEKHYITAGAHDLTENTLYVVLARLADAPADSLFLSCFLVPRWWVDPDTGETSDNHVQCVGVPRKMGLKGCPNTQLVFGRSGTTRAWLLGDRRNAGMLQFLTLAKQARVNSGIFAVGLSSTAYLNSVAYAGKRIQGRRLSENALPQAPRQAIIAHADVQRMLLDMKVRLEASRTLIGRVTWLSAVQAREEGQPAPDQELIGRCGRLIELLVPVVKTYTAEQAWKICATAIQVHGGIGYTDQAPVEQYTRDVKILSVWEGTSYVQSLLLIRDALGYGRNTRLLDMLEAHVHDRLASRPLASALALRQVALLDAMGACRDAMAQVQTAVREGRLDAISHYFTRIAGMFGLTLGAWGLLESGNVALHALAALDEGGATGSSEQAFYRGKVKSLHYFFDTLLPQVDHSLRLLKQDPPDYLVSESHEFAILD